MEERCGIIQTMFPEWNSEHVQAMGHVSFGSSMGHNNQELVDYLNVEQVLDDWPSILSTTVLAEIHFLKHMYECLLSLIGSLIHNGFDGGRRQCMILLFRYQLNAETPMRQQLIKNVDASLLHELAAARTKIEAVDALEILMAHCVRIISHWFLFFNVCVLVVMN